MTTYDSDTALDALLGRADEAVLAAVEDGLDLAAGRGAMRAAARPTNWRPAQAADWTAAIGLIRYGGVGAPAPCAENALLRELLGVLDEAERAARKLHSSLDSAAYGEMLLVVALRLQSLADTARLREADGPPTLRTLDQSRRIVARIQDGLADIEGLDGLERLGLTDLFALFDELLVRAQALVVRLFADDGELSFLPVPVR